MCARNSDCGRDLCNDHKMRGFFLRFVARGLHHVVTMFALFKPCNGSLYVVGEHAAPTIVVFCSKYVQWGDARLELLSLSKKGKRSQYKFCLKSNSYER